MYNKGRGCHWSSTYCQTSASRGIFMYLVQYSSMISTKVLFLKDTKMHFTVNKYIYLIRRFVV